MKISERIQTYYKKEIDVEKLAKEYLAYLKQKEDLHVNNFLKVNDRFFKNSYNSTTNFLKGFGELIVPDLEKEILKNLKMSEEEYASFCIASLLFQCV